MLRWVWRDISGSVVLFVVVFSRPHLEKWMHLLACNSIGNWLVLFLKFQPPSLHALYLSVCLSVSVCVRRCGHVARRGLGRAACPHSILPSHQTLLTSHILHANSGSLLVASRVRHFATTPTPEPGSLHNTHHTPHSSNGNSINRES